jgi:hypothetical protein
MAIPTKDSSQDKVNRKIDKNFFKPKKFVPLIERDFRDLATLAEQFEWIRQKELIKLKEDNLKNK